MQPDTLDLLRHWWSIEPPAKAIKATTPSIMRARVLEVCDEITALRARVAELTTEIEEMRR